MGHEYWRCEECGAKVYGLLRRCDWCGGTLFDGPFPEDYYLDDEVWPDVEEGDR